MRFYIPQVWQPPGMLPQAEGLSQSINLAGEPATIVEEDLPAQEDHFLTRSVVAKSPERGLPGTSIFRQMGGKAAGAVTSGPPKRDKLLARAIKQSQTEYFFRYGKIDPNHPAQVWLNEVANRLSIKNGFRPKFVLLPDWKDINALSYPDGTIFISAGMLKFAENVEALMGILAHEYVHAYREHVRKANDVVERKDSFGNRIINYVGLKRLHEYEADMRGVLEVLDQAGISPLPFKGLLEKFHRLEQRRSYDRDLAHGSSFDRALNVAMAAYLYDIKAIANDQTEPISQEILDSLESPTGKISHSAILDPPRGYIGDQEKLKGWKEKRNLEIGRLSVEEIPLMLAVLLEKSDEKRKYPDSPPPDPEDMAAVEKCWDLMAQALFPEESDFDLRRLKSFPYLELFGRRDADLKNFVKNYADLEIMRRALEQSPHKSPWTTLQKSLNEFWSDLLTPVFENFPPDVEDIQSFISKWSKTLAKISRRYDVHEIQTPDNFIRSALDEIQRVEKMPSSVRMKVAVHFTVEEKRETITINEQIESWGKKFAGQNVFNLYEGRAGFTTQFLEILGPNPSLTALISALGHLRLVLSGISFHEVSLHFSLTSSIPGLLVFWILGQSLNKIAATRHWSVKEKKRFLFVAASRLDLEDIQEQVKNNLPSPEDEDEAEIGSRQLEMLKDILTELQKTIAPESLFGKMISEEDVKFLYRYLFVWESFEKDFGQLTDSGTIWQSWPFVEFLAVKTPQEIALLFEKWEGEGIFIRAVLAREPDLCGGLVEKMAEALEKGELEGIPMKYLLLMGSLIANPFLQEVFQRYIMDQFWDDLNFEEKLDLLFPKEGKDRTFSGPHYENFMEKELQTQAQYEAVRKRVEETLDTVLEEGRIGAGLIAITQVSFRHGDPVAFLEALLTTSETDERLKAFVYECTAPTTDEQGVFSETTKANIINSVHWADEIVRLLLTLNPLAKQILLRKMLVGDGGILFDPIRKRAFFEMLFGKWIKRESGEENLWEVLREIQGVLVTMREWELLYFALQSTLRDQIAIPPDASAQKPWGTIKTVVYDLGVVNMGIPIPAFIDKTIWKERTSARKYPKERLRSFLKKGEDKLRSVLEQKGLLVRPAPKPMTPLRFIKETASCAGAMGVRFLQQMGLVFPNLPKEYQEEFMEVYDRVKGQSKLAALILMEREWPNMWEEIEEIGERLGGGSIFTVYKVRLKDGTDQVLKVRNPNITYHIKEMYHLASLVLDRLAREHNGSYSVARRLLDDIQEWLLADINFEGFLEEDAAFKAWADSQNFAKNGYRIYIPQSLGMASQYFAREEYVEAVNLTQWDKLLEEGHDMKSVAQLVEEFYMAQIGKGQVLSDLHPGNIAITRDKRVVIFDRNLYLKPGDPSQPFQNTLLAKNWQALLRMKKLAGID